MKFCPNCGEAIENNATMCSKCKKGLYIENNDSNVVTVYNETNNSNIRNNSVKGSRKKAAQFKAGVVPLITKYQKQFSAVFAALTILFLVLSVTTITSENYKEYSANYSEYMDNYKENSNISKEYGGYSILGSGYRNIADGWKDLADDYLAKLWGLRIKAIVFAAAGVSCGIITYKVYKTKDKANNNQ